MSALLLTHSQRINLLGIVVGCYPTGARDVVYKYDSPLEMLEDTHLKAYREELGSPSFSSWLADSWRKKIDKDIVVDTAGKIISILESSEKPIYLLNWGILTEIAHLVETIVNYKEELLDRIVIVSHFTSKATDNNYKKDKAAGEYLKGLAKSGKINFIELDKSGAKHIDDKTLPKISDSVLESKIGTFLGKKWQNNKPDFSDFATVVAVSFHELGFGKPFIDNAKTDSSSNLALFSSIFGKQKGGLYKIIEDAAKDAMNGGGIVIDPVEPVETPIMKAKAALRAAIEMLQEAETNL